MPTMKFTIQEEELITFKKRRYVRAMVTRAIEAGEIRKTFRCELCGKRCNTQAHHVDYGQPFKLVWVCYSCHGKVHKKDHMLNPNNNPQTPLPACLDQYKTVSVTFSVPVENFIVMKREAERLKTTLSVLWQKEALGKFPVASNQLEFDLGEESNGSPQVLKDTGVCSLGKDEGMLLQSEGTVLQKVRRKGYNCMSGMEAEFRNLSGRDGADTRHLQRACAN